MSAVYILYGLVIAFLFYVSYDVFVEEMMRKAEDQSYSQRGTSNANKATVLSIFSTGFRESTVESCKDIKISLY
ncbi:unnamed protein product [Cylicocyclus nassatus]|uniref:Uncharacterized protein n=1 Tax=Cylicocyclus nassatus TaxID=53992 RepID=A0AA36DPG9_CYLNA|nr:unnamed protein product [Cylicocyclus nassatus]